MKYFCIGITIFASIAVIGCTNGYQQQVDQSLLLQENRRLEDALYVTHAQLVDLKRENDALRSVRTEGSSSRASIPASRGKRIDFEPRDDYDDAPPFEAPKIDVPLDAPGSNVPPANLKTFDSVPKPMPGRKTATQTEEIVFPELTLPQNSVGELTPPAWSPTR